MGFMFLMKTPRYFIYTTTATTTTPTTSILAQFVLCGNGELSKVLGKESKLMKSLLALWIQCLTSQIFWILIKKKNTNERLK